MEGYVVAPKTDDYGGFQFYATTTEGNITIDAATASFKDMDMDMDNAG